MAYRPFAHLTDVAQHSSNKDLFGGKIKKLLLPMLEPLRRNGTAYIGHWTLGEIDMRTKTIKYYNSFKSGVGFLECIEVKANAMYITLTDL